MKRLLVLSAVVVIIFSGCATIVSGRRQAIDISSTKSAKVEIFDLKNNDEKVFEANTPTVAWLKRGNGFLGGKDYRFEITANESDGNDKLARQISPELNNGPYWGNFLLSGLLGGLIGI